MNILKIVVRSEDLVYTRSFFILLEQNGSLFVKNIPYNSQYRFKMALLLGFSKLYPSIFYVYR